MSDSLPKTKTIVPQVSQFLLAKIAPMLLQSHRGAGDLAAPNTLHAFELGWSLGTVPEADVRTTKDGVTVAFHDPTFERVLPDAAPQLRAQGVADFNWAQIAPLDIGAWKDAAFTGQGVPRMTDIYTAMQADASRQLYLDIKAADIGQLASEALKFGVETRVIIASPRYSDLQAWKRCVPGGKTMLWMGTWGKEDLSGLENNLRQLRADHFADVTIVQLHASLRRPSDQIERTDTDPFIPHDDYWRALAIELKSHNVMLQALPWGGASEAVYWKLLDLGAQSFATDYPQILLDALADYKPL